MNIPLIFTMDSFGFYAHSFDRFVVVLISEHDRV